MLTLDTLNASFFRYVLHSVISGLCLLGSTIGIAGDRQTAGKPDVERQQELAYLLEQDCGSCHGLTLKGGLGTPLTSAALQDRPSEYLFAVIRNGIPGTPMPPWSALLDDSEIRWIVQLLENDGVSQ